MESNFAHELLSILISFLLLISLSSVSRGVMLELELFDESPVQPVMSKSSVSVADLPIHDQTEKLHEGINFILSQYGTWETPLQWRTNEEEQTGKDTVSLTLTVYTKTEQLCLQLEELCHSDELQERLKGLFRAFGFHTNFKLMSRRIEEKCSKPVLKDSSHCAANCPHSLPLEEDSVMTKSTVSSQTQNTNLNTPALSLLDHLQVYENERVKFHKIELKWAKGMMNKYIVQGLLVYIQKNSPYVVNSHFTGSSYEGLKTRHADEFDIMIQLKHHDVEYRYVDGVPGYALMVPKVGSDDSFYHDLLEDGKVSPIKFRTRYFVGLVQRGVNHITASENQNKLEIRSSHGPAVQVDIIPGPSEKFDFTISVDLVLSYMFEDGNHFVAKPFKEYADSKDVKKDLPCNADLLWRKSFSLEEKKYLKKMDSNDQGCRHRCVRIIKTIFSCDTTLKKLTSYHIKTALLHYKNKALSWTDKDLGDRFLGILQSIFHYIRNKEMPHYYVENLNLLDGFKDVTLNNIQGRLEKIIKKLNDPQQQGEMFTKLLDKCH